MKVLSLLQPWASLAVMGIKKIETRGWSTTHRGALLIHASKGKAGSVFAEKQSIKKHLPDFKSLPFGAIIGMVALTDIIKTEALWLSDDAINNLTLEEKAFGNYEAGRYAWMFEDAVQFPVSFPAKGSMHVFNCPLYTENEIVQLLNTI